MTWTNLVGGSRRAQSKCHLLPHSLHLHRRPFSQGGLSLSLCFGGFSDRWKSWSWYFIHKWKCSAWKRFASLSQHRTFMWWRRMLEISSWKQCFCMVFEVFKGRCVLRSRLLLSNALLILFMQLPSLDCILTLDLFLCCYSCACSFILWIIRSMSCSVWWFLPEHCCCETFFYFQWR